MRRDMERTMEARASVPSSMMAIIGVSFFTVLMVTREGMEAAMMLIQVRSNRLFVAGGVGGLALAAAMSWAWAHFGHRINVKRFFQVTGIFLLLFAVQIAVYSFHEFSEAGILPSSEAISNATEPFSPVGVYRKWFSVVIVACRGAWLAGATVDRIRRARSAS